MDGSCSPGCHAESTHKTNQAPTPTNTRADTVLTVSFPTAEVGSAVMLECTLDDMVLDSVEVQVVGPVSAVLVVCRVGDVMLADVEALTIAVDVDVRSGVRVNVTAVDSFSS